MSTQPRVGSRTVSVEARRIPLWVRRFADEHGPTLATVTADGLHLQAGDRTAATLVIGVLPWSPPDGTDLQPSDLADALAAHLLAARRCAVLLVRRGGYAVAVLDGDRVVSSKVGHRYVQGRTAAGGWSQQRFARRRDNQTAELVGTAAEHAARLLVGLRADHLLVPGGDRALVERVLADPRLRDLARLPRARHLGVGDPRTEVLRAVPGLLREVRITLTGG